MDTLVQSRFGGVWRLLGVSQAQALSRVHVLVVGIGGVGSWTAEALARSGVGHLTLVDLDEICINNTNRQLHATEATVGQLKVAVMAARCRDINPHIEVVADADFFTAKTAERILGAARFDFVVDAIDVPKVKALMIAMCRARGIPMVTVGGAGGRVDPTQVVLGDLNKSRNDGLLRRVRKLLRLEHDFPRGHAAWGIPAIWSDELPVFPASDGGTCARPEQGPTRLDCSTGYGAASFVTGTVGFVAASVVIRALSGRLERDGFCGQPSEAPAPVAADPEVG